MTTTYSVLSTIAVSGGDISLNAGKLNITTCPQGIVYKKIVDAGGGLIAKTTAVAGVVTVTQSPSGANNTLYQFTLSQDLGQSIGVQNRTIKMTSDSSATNLEISSALRTQLLAYGYQCTVVVGTVLATNDTITITAAAGYEVIKGYAIQGGNLNVTQTTAGVYAQQAYADVYAILNPLGITGLATGKTYSKLALTYEEQTANFNGAAENILHTHILYVQDDATNYAAFASRMGEVLNDFKYLTNVADPEGLALI